MNIALVALLVLLTLASLGWFGFLLSRRSGMNASFREAELNLAVLRVRSGQNPRLCGPQPNGKSGFLGVILTALVVVGIVAVALWLVA
jgi:hypothetical protein